MVWSIGAGQTDGWDIGAGQEAVISAPKLGDVFYVDYDSGSDANDGLTTSTAWKHCPGDTSAAGVAALHTPQAGESFRFRGGVVYRSLLTVTESGTAADNIRYVGDEWGGTAILSAAEPISISFTACTDQADALGNANWANIYKASLPAQITSPFSLLLYNNGSSFAGMAQDYVPAHSMLIDDVTEWSNVVAADITQTTYTNSVFSSSDSAYYDGAYIGVRRQGNWADFRPITAFNPATDTITFDALASAPYSSDQGRYTIVGLPQDIQSEGQWGSYDGEMYMWRAADAPAGSTGWEVGTRSSCVHGSGVGHITIEGFSMHGAWGDFSSSLGRAINFSIGTNTHAITIRDVDISNCRSMDRERGLRIIGPGGMGTGHRITNVSVIDYYGGAVLVNGSDCEVVDCTFARTSRVACYFAGVAGGLINNSTFNTIRGSHANAASIYQGSSDIVISRCRFVDAPSLFTYQDCSNLTFYANFFDANGENQLIEDNSANTNITNGYIRWINNTLVGHVGNGMLRIYAASTADYIHYNNIIDGGGTYAGVTLSPPWEHTEDSKNNIYTQLANWQGGTWVQDPTESQHPATDIFTDPGNGDYTIKSGSPTINAGIDVSSFGFSTDILGEPAPIGVWDVGARQAVVGSPGIPSFSVVLKPDPAAWSAIAVDPQVIVGSTSSVPAPGISVWRGVSPAVILGSVPSGAISPSPGLSSWMGVGVGTSLSSILVSPTPGLSSWVAVDPTTRLGSITVSPDSGSASWVGVDPESALGSIIVSPPSGSVSWVGVDPGSSPEVVLTSPSPGLSSWIGVGVGVGAPLGGVTVSPDPGSASWLGVDPETVLGSTSVSPGPSLSSWVGVDPTTDLGSVIADPRPALSSWLGVDPFVRKGSVRILPPAGLITWLGVDPGTAQSGVTVSPDPGSASWLGVDPRTGLSSVNVSPSPGSVSWLGIDPTATVPDEVVVKPEAGSASWLGTDPVIILSSTAADPAAGSVYWLGADPAVGLSSTTVLPSIGSVSWEASNPRATLGSLSLAPSIGSVTWLGGSPNMIFGSVSAKPGSPGVVLFLGRDPVTIGDSLFSYMTFLGNVNHKLFQGTV